MCPSPRLRSPALKRWLSPSLNLTRYGKRRKPRSTRASSQDGFTRRLSSVPDSLRKTLTYDQGTEMAMHQTLGKRLRIDVFFCDPYSTGSAGPMKTPTD